MFGTIRFWGSVFDSKIILKFQENYRSCFTTFSTRTDKKHVKGFAIILLFSLNRLIGMTLADGINISIWKRASMYAMRFHSMRRVCIWPQEILDSSAYALIWKSKTKILHLSTEGILNSSTYPLIWPRVQFSNNFLSKSYRELLEQFKACNNQEFSPQPICKPHMPRGTRLPVVDSEISRAYSGEVFVLPMNSTLSCAMSWLHKMELLGNLHDEDTLFRKLRDISKKNVEQVFEKESS